MAHLSIVIFDSYRLFHKTSLKLLVITRLIIQVTTSNYQLTLVDMASFERITLVLAGATCSSNQAILTHRDEASTTTATVCGGLSLGRELNTHILIASDW